MARRPKINKRIVSTKSHTIGYILTGGKEVTRKQAVTMANRGQINGVRVATGPNGSYIQSSTSRRLYDLPTIRRSNKNSTNARCRHSKRTCCS